MIDLETIRVIDFLDSREKDPVMEWLKTFPNIQIVSRDGSQIYASAISSSHPEAEQVCDRFHLLKNLSETVRKYLTRLFPSRLDIPAVEKMRSPEMQAL